MHPLTFFRLAGEKRASDLSKNIRESMDSYRMIKKAYGGSYTDTSMSYPNTVSEDTESSDEVDEVLDMNSDNPRKRARRQARQRRQLRTQKRTKGCRGSHKTMFGSISMDNTESC